MKNLSDAQLAFYKEQGYIVVDDVLPKENLDAIARSIRRIVRFHIRKAQKIHDSMPEIPEGREFSDGMAALDAVDHSHIAEIYDTLLSTPEGFRLTSRPRITRMVNQLLGDDPEAPLFATQCGVLLFMPRDAEHWYTWHKDTFYTVPESTFVQLWAPVVEDSTVDLGTVKICPKSHKAGWREQIDVAKDGRQPRYRYQVSDSAVAKYEPIDVPVRLGQVLLFDPGMIHRSGNNTSDTCRFTLLGFFHQIENERFRPLLLRQAYVGKTPDQYFAELFGVDV